MSSSAPVISTVAPPTSAAPTTMSAPPSTPPPTTAAPPTVTTPSPPVETSVAPSSPPPSSAPPSSPPPATVAPTSEPPASSPPASSTPLPPSSTPIVSSVVPTPSTPASTPLPSPAPSSVAPSVTLIPTPTTSLSSIIPTLPSSTTVPTITTVSRISPTSTPIAAISDTALVTELSTAVLTLTSAGRLVTITSVITAVVPAASARTGAAAADANGRLNAPSTSEGKTGFFSNTGAVAGTFVVLGLVVLGGLIALARFIARRKRARRLDEDIRIAAGGAGAGGAGVDRFGDDDEGGNPFADEDSSGGHYQGYATTPNMAQYAPLALSSHAASQRMSGVYVEGTPRRSQEFSTSSNGSNGPRTMQPAYDTNGAYAPVGYYNQRPHSLGPIGAAYGEDTSGYRDEQPVRSRDYSGGSGEAAGYSSDSPRHSGSAEGVYNSGFGQQSSPIPYQQPAAVINRRDSGESYYADLSRQNTVTAPPVPVLRGSDERLDPNIGMRAPNDSVASLGDERDYSRVLRVMNARE